MLIKKWGGGMEKEEKKKEQKGKNENGSDKLGTRHWIISKDITEL